MGKNERQAYLKAIRFRYYRAGKKATVTILDEFCAVCGYHRKYAIRLLNKRSGRGRRSAITFSAITIDVRRPVTHLKSNHACIIAKSG